MPFDRVEDALEDIRQGKMIIVADDEDRENEGDLVCAAESVTPEIVNFMAQHGRGLICVALTREHADRLGLHPMTDVNTDPKGTAFTVSVDGDNCRIIFTPVFAIVAIHFFVEFNFRVPDL